MSRAAAAACAVAVLVLAPATTAHKGITSKYTFNADVHPVFLNRCSRCHIEGGVGPMSLLKYEDAFPWAEALRAELLSAATGDPHDFIKAAHRQISARELDVVLDWATGGTPEGDKASAPAVPPLQIDWTEGHPDVVAEMPKRYDMEVTALEDVHETALPISTSAPSTVDRIDLLPGNPAIVRSAVLSLRAPDGTIRALGTWVPRQIPAAIALKPPVRIDPGSQIVARISYKKTWKYEGQLMSDLSRVGLYLAR
jgi:hypothetical protein